MNSLEFIYTLACSTLPIQKGIEITVRHGDVRKFAPVREPGSLLVRLIRHNPDAACREGC